MNSYGNGVSELSPYMYAALKNRDSLRLLCLRPAADDAEAIDCELIDIDLPYDYEEREPDSDRNAWTRFGDHDRDVVGEEEVAIVDVRVRSDFGSSDEESEHVVMRAGAAYTNSEGDWPRNEEFQSRHSRYIRGWRPGEQLQYEALSWCWGNAAANEVLRVTNDYGVFGLRISSNLKNALRALRRPTEMRRLWIDAICINQNDTSERNEQVARMDKIYGRASNVCIWLGEGNEDSKLALDFIKQNLANAWEFDSLVQDPDKAKHWAALITLMKRPWFSRRWVVQEISLSPKGGTLYCGRESVPWQDFSDAVSLLVEVETATHRLSDMLKVDETFRYIPDFVGNVSSLGASLLVYTTSSLFHSSASGSRTPLSSLEHLVCRLSMFEVTQPRDTIYSLLAISTDASPSGPPVSEQFELSMKENYALSLVPRGGFYKKSYNVDYSLPVVDVYMKFVEFCIRNGDPVRALDIICRPWAPPVKESHDNPGFIDDHSPTKHDRDIPLPSWISDLSGAAFEMEQHPTAGLRMERQNADPLVGMPDGSRNRNYSAAGNLGLDPTTLKFVKWKSVANPGTSYPEYSLFLRGFILDEVSTVEHPASNGNIPYRWLNAGGWTNTEMSPPDDFWRTLVADRGSMGRNAPSYFRRACKESMRFKPNNISKRGGYLDVKTLINDGRCTIVAEFLRRVQEVVWNRSLMTTNGYHLGLVRDDVWPGFRICILYGCSVPVILQEIRKSPDELQAEKDDDYSLWRDEMKRFICQVQARWRMKILRKGAAKKEVARQPPRILINAPKESFEEPGAAIRLSGGDRPGLQKTTSTNSEQRTQLDSPKHDTPSKDIDLANPKVNGIRYTGSSTPEKDVERSESIKRKSFKNMTDQEKQEEREKGKREFKARKMREKRRSKPKKTYYRFVGECYVHGMMNGEAIAFQQRNKIEAQVFEIR